MRDDRAKLAARSGGQVVHDGHVDRRALDIEKLDERGAHVGDRGLGVPRVSHDDARVDPIDRMLRDRRADQPGGRVEPAENRRLALIWNCLTLFSPSGRLA